MLLDLYDEEYFLSPDPVGLGYDKYVDDFDNITATFEKRWRVVERHLSNEGRVLDIGCAHGFLLNYLRQRGYQTYGVEVSHAAASYARNKLGLNVLMKPLREAAFQDDFFDVIAIWDLVEHFTDPSAELREMHRILKPGGVLAIITPDSGSFQAKFWGRRWVEYLRPDEHLSYFSRDVLIKHVRAAGFDLLEATTAGKYVTVDFVLNRLKEYDRCGVGAVHALLKFLKLQNRVLYVDPKDKMFVIFRKKPRPVE
jgi:SAM-dependent methyltransferase